MLQMMNRMSCGFLHTHNMNHYKRIHYSSSLAFIKRTEESSNKLFAKSPDRWYSLHFCEAFYLSLNLCVCLYPHVHIQGKDPNSINRQSFPRISRTYSYGLFGNNQETLRFFFLRTVFSCSSETSLREGIKSELLC